MYRLVLIYNNKLLSKISNCLWYSLKLSCDGIIIQDLSGLTNLLIYHCIFVPMTKIIAYLMNKS